MPLGVAHRGSSGSYPEHTLLAYERAIADGADALECDVRLTRDGVLVCVHDRRVDRTSDGRGTVSTLELADLAELDFAAGADLGVDRDDVDPERTRVLTLERLLQLVVSSRSRPVQLHIEAKHPTRYGGLVERSLVDLLARYGLAEPPSRAESRVTVMSFSALSLRRLHAMAPALPTVFLMARLGVRRDGSLPGHLWAAGPSISLVRRTPEYVERAHAHGNRVHVWTVNEPADCELVLSLGADAVITDHPRRVLSLLGR